MEEFKKELKKHNRYRTIALILKLVAVVILTFAFRGVTLPVNIPRVEAQTLGTLLTTIFSLVVYYGAIFLLNRYRNFHSISSFKISLLIYSIVIIGLIILESTYSGVLQNSIYRLFNLGFVDQKIISISSTYHPFVYLLIGLLVHFLFSTVTGFIIFFLYKYILDQEQIIGKQP